MRQKIQIILHDRYAIPVSIQEGLIIPLYKTTLEKKDMLTINSQLALFIVSSMGDKLKKLAIRISPYGGIDVEQVYIFDDVDSFSKAKNHVFEQCGDVTAWESTFDK